MEPEVLSVLRENFEFHYYTDKTNAAANRAPARFRPLTVVTATQYLHHTISNWTDDPRLVEVMDWAEKYGSVS